MDPVLAQKAVHIRRLRWVIVHLAGELRATAVDGEFGLAGAVGVPEVLVGGLVAGKEGELWCFQQPASFPTPPKSYN